MNQSLEIESKCLLTEEQYKTLLEFFENDSYIQKNFYFDTENFDLKKLGFSIRIRIKKDYAEATVKEDKQEGRKESNFPISFDQANDVISGKACIFPLISSVLPSIFLNYKIVLKGSLKTERIDFPYKNGLLSLDKNSYKNITDYEIEYESDSKNNAESILLDFLKEKGVNAPLSTISKFRRATI